MGKGRIKRFLQRLAIMLSVVLAVPQVPMVSNLGLGLVRAHADEKKDPYFSFWVDRNGIISEKITFTHNFAILGENDPAPTGSIQYEYSTSPVVYTNETDFIIDHEKMTWTVINSASASSDFVWTVSDGVIGKKVTFYATYSGDDIYNSGTYYLEEDFRVPVTTKVTPVTRSTEEATSDKYTFDLYLDWNDMNPGMFLVEAPPVYYIKLTPYEVTGYENTKPVDLVKDENILPMYNEGDGNAAPASYFDYIYDEIAGDDMVPAGIRVFMDSNLTQGFYVFQIVGVYNGVLSEKNVTTPFMTGKNVLNADDLKAAAATDATISVTEIDGVEQIPDIVLSVCSSDEERKAVVENWLSYAEDEECISYYFIQKIDRKGEEINSDPAVTSAAISVAGIYGIYAVSTDPGVTISPCELGSILVEQAPPSDKPEIKFGVSVDKESYIATVDTSKIENATADKTLEYSFDGGRSFSGESTYTSKPDEKLLVGVRFAKGGELIPPSDPVVVEVTAPGRSEKPGFEEITDNGKKGIRITANSSIYYTTDGTDPTLNSKSSTAETGSELNTVDIFLEENVTSMTVKAFAIENGKVRSSVISISCKINADDNSLTITEIPVTGLDFDLKADKVNLSMNSVTGITALITPASASDKSIIWTVKNIDANSTIDPEKIVKLSNKYSDSGEVVKITGLQKGSVIITAAACDNVNICKSITVEVTESTVADSCNITFNANGGSGSMDAVTVNNGDFYILPACGFTAPAEKEFDGWNLGAAGVQVEITADTELTAKWKDKVVKTYYIIFHANGGKGKMTKMSVKKGKMVKLRKNKFKRAGYVFTGWNTKKNGKGVHYKNKAKITVSSSINLYAQWKQKIKLSLHGFTIKKNRKFTVTATLKIYGKAVKGKKVLLVINDGKKSYKKKVKTDIKGVAKFEFTKEFTKELEVGRKVTIEVSYGDVTVKKKVEVK